MGRYDNTKRNQYNSTPRKVFDAYIDKMALRRDRDRADHMADLGAILKQLKQLEIQLQEIREEMELTDALLAEVKDQAEDGCPCGGTGTEEL